MDRIVLGGVQFGLSYGISNQTGQISMDEAGKIIEFAYQHGVRLIDTAYAYGDSESVIGKILGHQKFPGLQVITKTWPKTGTINEKDLGELKRGFETSLERLRQDRLYSLMLHRAENLLGLGKESVYKFLHGLKSQGIIKKIGCSFYSLQDLLNISKEFEIDLIQVPGNVFDQRFLQPALIEQLQSKGVEIHVRSLFLQGLLFYVEKGSLPEKMAFTKPYVDKLKHFCQNYNMDVLELALRFGLSRSNIKLVLGVSKLEELKAIHEKLQLIANTPLKLDFSSLSVEDLAIIDPTKWPKN